MKRVLSVVLTVLLIFSFTACQKAIPGEFVVTQEYINEKLNNNGFDVSAQPLDKGRGGGTIETAVDFSTSLSSTEDDSLPFGTLFLQYENSFCHRMSLMTYMQYKGWENTEKIINFVCDVFGSDGKAIVIKVKECFENDNLEYGVIDSVAVEFFDNGFHYAISFLPETEGDYSLENLNLVSMIIMEENRYKAAEEEGEKNRLKLITDNPLLYSDGEPDWPQWETDVGINQILTDLKLPFTAEFEYYSKTDIGTANTAYAIYNSEKEKSADISTVRCASGYQYSIIQNILDGNNVKIRMGTEDMLKIACSISDTEYSDALLNIVNGYLSADEFTAYFEYGGCYWRANFYNDYAGDLKYNRYLYNVTVYQPDVFKGTLLNWINSLKENNMDCTEDQQVYDKFFG